MKLTRFFQFILLLLCLYLYKKKVNRESKEKIIVATILK
jgi:hypothetical protein